MSDKRADDASSWVATVLFSIGVIALLIAWRDEKLPVFLMDLITAVFNAPRHPMAGIRQVFNIALAALVGLAALANRAHYYWSNPERMNKPRVVCAWELNTGPVMAPKGSVISDEGPCADYPKPRNGPLLVVPR